MTEIDQESKSVRRGLRRQELSEDLLKSVSRLEALVQELKDAEAPKDKALLGRQYSDAMAGLLANVNKEVRRPYWEAASRSFEKFSAMRNDMYEDLESSNAKRMERWFLKLR